MQTGRVSRFNAAAAADPETLESIPADPAALAAALERAMAGRQALLLEAEAAPHAPALREALRLSNALVERVLARLAAVTPPEAGERERAA